MAYAALVSLSATIKDMLDPNQHLLLLDQKPTSLQIFHSLQACVNSLLQFLKTFPPDLTMEVEDRIRDGAHRAEFIIDQFISYELIRKYCPEKYEIQYSSHQSVELLYRDLSDVKEKIDQILEEVKEMKISSTNQSDAQIKHGGFIAAGSSKLSHTEGDAQSKHDKTARASDFYDNVHGEVAMVGREDDLMSLRLRLCEGSSKREVIPITGMGGSGKTTLARHLYTERLIVEKFDVCSWVAISQEYRIQDILLKILQQFDVRSWVAISQEYRIQDILQKTLPVDGQREQNVESLVVRVYKYLKGRRYLIVLDDVWDGEAWDALRACFPEDNNGSRVVLTTRIDGVASYIDPSSPCHRVNLLSEDQSWKLLETKIFGEESCPPELKEIGRNISKKCKGLPLAVVLIAWVLKRRITLHDWQEVAKNVISTLSNSGDAMSGILSLSYNHLPHHLKPCFVHVGAAFPEDYQIDASTLIRLWVAEGFLEPDGNRSLEEIAEEYLEDLVKRNLVSAISRKYHNGKIECCSIHDILREWCVRRAEEQNFLFHLKRENDDESRDATMNHCRISFHSNADGSAYLNGPYIRSVMFFKKDKRLITCIKQNRLLRVVHSTFSSPVIDLVKGLFKRDFLFLSKFMDDIFELFRLKYLCLKLDCEMRCKLPSSFSRLVNLQTLILECDNFYLDETLVFEVQLPVEIWGMSQLRHLILGSNGNFLLPNSPHREMCVLPNLQTLSKSRDLECSKEIVNMMPNMKELELVYGGKSSKLRRAVYQLKNLGGMNKLQRLHLHLLPNPFGHPLGWNPTEIVFPETLVILQLECCRFPWECMEMIGSLPNLEVLELGTHAFLGRKWETRDGEFRQLKVLSMKGLRLSHWIVSESSHFPRLGHLYLNDLGNLLEIPSSIGEISTLQLIEVKGCNSFVRASAKRILEEQRDMGNELLEVRTSSNLMGIFGKREPVTIDIAFDMFNSWNWRRSLGARKG